MTDKQKNTIRQMRGRGLQYRAIANSLGFTYNTVKSFCYRGNLTATDSPGDEVQDDQTHCKNCGKMLRHNPGRRKKFYCSDKCRYIWWNKLRKYSPAKRIYRLNCFGCGIEFDTSNKNRRYCGRDCYIQSRHGEGLT